jgi:hypothetical protein
LRDSYTKNTTRISMPRTEESKDSRLIRREPTKMLMESRFVRVSELKKDENSSIRNKTSKKE